VFVPPRGASYDLYRPLDEDDEEACHGAGGGMRALDGIRRCQWRCIPSELRSGTRASRTTRASASHPAHCPYADPKAPLSDPTDRSALLYIFKHTVRFGRPSIPAVVVGKGACAWRATAQASRKAPIAGGRAAAGSMNVRVDTYEWAVGGSDGVLRTGVWARR
jgi:hypothetical protein